MVKVLVVEDEHTQAEVLTMLFSLEGFEVTVVHNGREALAQLDRVQPELIVTDFMMPLMNGGEMAKLVRATPLHAKVPIVMTSATNAGQVEKYSGHYDAFLRKPYLWDDLVVIIGRLLSPPKVA
jgi:two-component system, OmpR family, response regulator VicR